MPLAYNLIFLFSFSAGLISLFLLKKFFLKNNLLLSKGVPLAGGISMGLAFIGACIFGVLICRPFSHQIKGLLISSSIMLIFGIIDDYKEMSIIGKFLVQIIATVLLVSFGIKTQIVSIGPVLNLLLTFIWVLGITNAINHLDVADGVAGSVAVFSALGFLTIAFLTSDIQSIIISLALAGAIFSFLILNLPPAKAYMGNSGSHFLGFVLAALAILIRYAPMERKIALLAPVMILGFPIFDTAFLIYVRLMKKRVPFKKSNDHLSLKILVLGHSKRKALLEMVVWGIFFSLSGVALSQSSNGLGLVIIAIVVFLSLAFAKIMSKVEIDG